MNNFLEGCSNYIFDEENINWEKVRFAGFITKFWGKKEKEINPKNSMLGARS
jgi:hypothetical protein